MKIYSVFDPEFKPYGQVVTGMDETVAELLNVLKDAPQGPGVDYVPEYAPLQELPACVEISEHCYGGMPVQLGWCNGFNTKLNCLEYHRDSEFNLGTEDFILLLGLQGDIVDGVLDTATIKAFKAPAGTLIEVFATALHYAPCHCDPNKGFRVMVALPAGTNTDYRPEGGANTMDRMLWARNKWLLAHAKSAEAKGGAPVLLDGVNVDIGELI